ncbi:MAG: hypothetical protein ABIO44_09515, partial [Saprospiraceae bacterium]
MKNYLLFKKLISLFVLFALLMLGTTKTQASTYLNEFEISVVAYDGAKVVFTANVTHSIPSAIEGSHEESDIPNDGLTHFDHIGAASNGLVLNNEYRLLVMNNSSLTLPPCPIVNLNTLETFCTIQAAIAAPNTLDGHTISVPAGTYTENITVYKAIKLQGPNVGIPGIGVRGAEAKLLNCNIDVTASGMVIIDGFHIYQTDANADVILINGGTPANIQNNRIERFGVVAGQIVRAITTASGAALKTIQNNLFTGDLSGGVFSGHKTWNNGIYINGAGSSVSILNNTLENCRTAISLDDFNNGIVVAGNTLDHCGTFMGFGGTVPTNGQYILGSNNFKNPQDAIINLSNVNIAFRLDITSSSFNGVVFSSLPVATLF